MPINQPAPRFAIRNLSVLARAQGFTFWHYRAHQATQIGAGDIVPAATVRDVTAEGFFPPFADQTHISGGDMIHVSCSDGAITLSVFANSKYTLRYLPMQQATVGVDD